MSKLEQLVTLKMKINFKAVYELVSDRVDYLVERSNRLEDQKSIMMIMEVLRGLCNTLFWSITRVHTR